jgi:hypothetical protein
VTRLQVRLMMPEDLQVMQDYLQSHERAWIDEWFQKRLSWPGVFVVALANGELVAAGGLSLHWPGVAEAWYQVTPLAQQYRISLVRQTKIWLEELMAAKHIWRVQAIVKDHDDAGHRLMKCLGFFPEGLMTQFAQDREDCHLYALVRKDIEP